MESSRIDSNENIASLIHIFIVTVLAAGIRIYLWKSFPHVIFLHEADAIGYIGIARNMVENFSISNATHFPPFYPALIALFSLVTGDYESGSRWASIIMGAGMVIPLYLACRYFMTSRAAFCAALVAACFDPFVDHSLQPVSQATYAALIALGVWLGLRCIRQPGTSTLVFFGVTSAALYLTRPEGILFFAGNFPLLAIVIYKEKSGIKLLLQRLVAVVAGFCLPCFWYIINLKRYTGYWTVSGKSGGTSIGVDASLKLMQDGRTFGEAMADTAGLASLFTSVSGFLTTYVAQFGKFSMVAYSALPGVVFGIAAIGMVLLVHEPFQHQRGRRFKSICSLAMFLSPLLLIVPVMAFDKIGVSVSYIVPFFIVLFCCGAKGTVWLEEVLAKRVLPPLVVRQGISVAVIGAMALSWYSCLPVYQRLSSDEFAFMSGQQDFLLRRTGHWFRNYTDSSAKLMARWSNIGFYGERGWIGLVDGSIEEVTAFAKQKGVTHMVIDSDAVPRRRPQLKDLLEPSLPHHGLIPVYAAQQFDTRVVIYQLQ